MRKTDEYNNDDNNACNKGEYNRSLFQTPQKETLPFSMCNLHLRRTIQPDKLTFTYAHLNAPLSKLAYGTIKLAYNMWL